MKVSKFRIAGFFLCIFLVAILILGFLNKLFVLNILTTLLAVAAGSIAVATKTKDENAATFTLTGWGKLLLAVSLLAGMTTVITSYLKEQADKTAINNQQQQTASAQKTIAELDQKVQQQNQKLDGTNEKLSAQKDLSVSLSQRLLDVQSELLAERTPIRHVFVTWRLWLKPASGCLSEMLKHSETLHFESKAEIAVQGGLTSWVPDLDELPEHCKGSIRAAFSKLFLTFSVWADHSLGNKKSQLDRDWTFEVQGEELSENQMYFWNPDRRVMLFDLGAQVDEEWLRRPEGTPVSLLDVSEAKLQVTESLGNLLLHSEGYGIDCLILTLNFRLGEQQLVHSRAVL